MLTTCIVTRVRSHGGATRSASPAPVAAPAPGSAEEGELSEDELEKKRALLMKELESTQG